MTTPKCEDAGPLKEWAPPTALLESIPARTGIGLFNHNINFTCIAALCDFIAVGTNAGVVYWYNRETHETTKLNCWCINTNITCLEIISTVDYMVAVGSDKGVKIFRIPKVIPDSVPERMKPKENKKEHSIKAHKSTVTAIGWSKNGMHLFSGDNNGLVIVADFDYYNVRNIMNTIEVIKLCNEKYPIIQLSNHGGLLLISSTLRTILLDRCDSNKVTQIGQKERKNLGPYGAIFRHSYVKRFVIYATRPGFRIWEADRKGTVLKTLMFKDTIKFNETHVQLLNPAPENVKNSRTETSFGTLLQFNEDYLITYNNDIIYIVNPQNITVTTVTDVRRVTHVACTKEEIFIVEGDRNIIRISYYPDTTAKDVMSFPALSQSRTAGLLELTTIIAESKVLPVLSFSRKKQNDETLFTSSTFNDNTSMEENLVIDAEEAVEMPSTSSGDSDTYFQTDLYTQTKEEEKENKQNLRRQIFDKISEQDFEDVVFTPEKRMKKLRSMSQNRNKCKTSISNKTMQFSSRLESIQKCMSTSIDDKFLIPSKRDLELLKRDVENKEKLLAHMLDFDLIFSKQKKFNATSKIIDIVTDPSNSIPSSVLGIQTDNVNSNSEFSSNDVDHLHIKDQKNEGNQNNDNKPVEPGDEETSYQTMLDKFKGIVETNKKLTKSNSTIDESIDKIPVKLPSYIASYEMASKMLQDFEKINKNLTTCELESEKVTELECDKGYLQTVLKILKLLSLTTQKIRESKLKDKELIGKTSGESEKNQINYNAELTELGEILKEKEEIKKCKLKIQKSIGNQYIKSKDDKDTIKMILLMFEILEESANNITKNQSKNDQLFDNASDKSESYKITNETMVKMLEKLCEISKKEEQSELKSEKFIDNVSAETGNDEACQQTELKESEELEKNSQKVKRSKLSNAELVVMEDLQDFTQERTTRATNSDSSWSDLELDLPVLNESITASYISEDEDWVLVNKYSPKIDKDQVK
ncbi:hypothetical protein M0802_002470 [Mischocyttarus mexicanus]|nr:hypothetical protein M0802_002470 [Mischocyttarus mexicanus]